MLISRSVTKKEKNVNGFELKEPKKHHLTIFDENRRTFFFVGVSGICAVLLI